MRILRPGANGVTSPGALLIAALAVITPVTVLMPLGTACAASSPSSAVARNTVACQYVDWNYVDVFQRPPKDTRPDAFPEKVAAAASATLRRELAYWKAATAYKNWTNANAVGIAMANTCARLRLSRRA